MKTKYSLTSRITQRLLISLSLLMLCSSILVYLDAREEVDELFDASLVQTARVLNGLLTLEAIQENKQRLLNALAKKDANLSDFTEAATPLGHKYEKKLFFQIWSADKELLLKSASIHTTPPILFQQGFRDEIIDGQQWRTFTLFSEKDPFWMVVGERDDIRSELVHNISRDHALPLLIFIPAFALTVWLLIRSGFRPLHQLVTHVKKQEYNSLASSEIPNTPSEIIALKHALNELFSRLSASYQRENRFASDAAHEFKNPLAALLIHVDDLLETSNNQEHTASLLSIKKAAQQLSHLVNQLLALSRAEASIEPKTSVDLRRVCYECYDQLASKAEHKRHQFSLDIEESGSSTENAGKVQEKKYTIQADEILLIRSISNLLDNAIRYTPTEGKIRLHCFIENDHPCITIDDSGPGIPDVLCDKVFDRFFRISGSGQSGSGLGLSIVQQGANYHDAELLLGQSDLGGLKASFVFEAQHQ